LPKVRSTANISTAEFNQGQSFIPATGLFVTSQRPPVHLPHIKHNIKVEITVIIIFLLKNHFMKHISTALLLLSFTIINTGCIKNLLKKKKEEPVAVPEAKYYGTWKATSRADDFNNNNILDANEVSLFAGNSELKLNEGKTFTYFLTTNSGSTNLNGTWTMATDQKSVTASDPAQGALRFDYRSDNEMQTEPISTANGTVWLIYKRQ
jgi:hypothetical protein